MEVLVAVASNTIDALRWLADHFEDEYSEQDYPVITVGETLKDRLIDLADECPMCAFAALRQSEAFVWSEELMDQRVHFNLKEELQKFNKEQEIREARAEQGVY